MARNEIEVVSKCYFFSFKLLDYLLINQYTLSNIVFHREFEFYDDDLSRLKVELNNISFTTLFY